MNIEDILIEKLKNSLAILEVENQEIHIERPADSKNGDYSTNVAMSLSKVLKKNPIEIAEQILESIEMDDSVERIEIAKPGFINFYLTKNTFSDVVSEILKSGENVGKGKNLKGKRIMMEYAHPNPFKSFHIGHLRNIILGESLIRLLESQGAEVIRVNYQGDVGMHIAKCIWALRKIDPKDYPRTTDEKVALLGKCYAEGATAYEEDKTIYQEIREINKKIYSGEDAEISKLWEMGKKWSLEKFHEIYKRVDSTFEREYMESEVMDLGVEKVKEAIEKNILTKSEGAIIFDGSKYGMDTRVFLNSEGLPTYEGKELGLAYREFTDFGKIDLCIHNVAVEQISFFKVTFKVEELIDPEMFKDKQYHNAYEFVGLKTGKMSSRKGQVVLGNDILDQAKEKVIDLVKVEEKEETAEKIGVGAVKYSFLKISPKTYLSFDINESVSLEGDSGPYIMYTLARTHSVLEKAGSDLSEIKVEDLNEVEFNIVKHLSTYSQIVQKASESYSPNHICSYLYDLAQMFNKFYNDEQILTDNSAVKSKKVTITKAVQSVLSNGLYLLGINAPERM